MTVEMHKEIKALKGEILAMASLALEMLEGSMDALVHKDINLAKKVFDKKDQLKEYDYRIEEKALHLLHLFQPMAVDFRRIATILKMITYLARIGRYGKDIAKITQETATRSSPVVPINITHMWEHVQYMITTIVEAFNKSEIEKIQDFEERDDEIDKLRWAVFRECITYMMEDPKSITDYAHYLMIARYLERCGDHACKMAEKIHYMVTGNHIEIS